jgi:hypothetical protein
MLAVTSERATSIEVGALKTQKTSLFSEKGPRRRDPEEVLSMRTRTALLCGNRPLLSGFRLGNERDSRHVLLVQFDGVFQGYLLKLNQSLKAL